MGSMGECETRSVHACESPGEDAGGKAVVPDDDGIVALSIYCPRGQATSPHRTVTWTEQGVQKDKETVQ